MKDPILRFSRAFSLVVAALASACSLVVERAPSPGAPHDPSAGQAASKSSAPVAESAGEVIVERSPVSVPLPSSMSCVSSPFDDGAPLLQVLRAGIVGNADAATVRLVKGTQFASHGGSSPSKPADQDVHEVTRSADGTLLEQPGGLRIQLHRQGPVMRGSLSLTGERAQALALTCWNESELLGSPWTGEPGLLPARFDWSVGACVNKAGEPALNPTPIEVVRETRSGECSDLRDVALNGDDLAVPDLDGWRLVGARLDGARLSFANMHSAILQGADLAGLEFGYATVQGSIDSHTTLPGDLGCEVTRSPWAGDSISCTR